MRLMARNSQTFYIVNKTKDNKNNIVYNQPIEVAGSVKTITNAYVLATIGDLTKDIKQIYCDSDVRHICKDGDRVYLNVDVSQYDRLGSKADYLITSIIPNLSYTMLTISRINNG